MNRQTRLFAACIDSIGVTASIWPDGRLHVLSHVSVRNEPTSSHHDTYSPCLDEELLTVIEATLAARQVEAVTLAAVMAARQVLEVEGAAGSRP
jgi:hypothetical protein